jgi:hypothetical protein
MSTALPQMFNYTEDHSAIPSSMKSYTQTISPSNGSTFTAGGDCYPLISKLDLPMNII